MWFVAFRVQTLCQRAPHALLLATGYGLLATTASAVEIRVLEADTLEVRPINVPGGGTTDLLVITGSPVRLTVDGDAITAEYIEFDREARLMRIVGPGDVGFEGVVTQGRDYLLDVSSEELNVRDVVIFTEPIDIQGVQATRMPGQIDITSGAFSPCSRCDQRVQDYRFRADRLTLYPGDRLIAYGVTVFLRELPSLYLPVMVVPLGPEERRPRFSVSQGTATTRASAALDWPYVFGADAFGTLALRYYADVTPGASQGPTEGLLGGRVDENYLGGGFDGRFYTATGEGEFGVFYTPPFNDRFDASVRTEDQLELTFGYSTQEALGGTQFEVLVERDDTSNPRILEYTARVGGRLGGPLAPFGVRYVTQGYLDLNPGDDIFQPNYSDGEGALRTLSRVQLEAEEGTRFTVGPFALSAFRLDVGVFEDFANPNNTSVGSVFTLGGQPVVRHGRLLETHTLELAPVVPFAGASLSGRTTFTGQYYTSQNTGGEFERLVDWNTTLTARQEFGIGSFELAFQRNILEGETPFRFDARTTPNNRTDLTSTFRLRPAAWFDLQLRETYVFQDSRSSDVLPNAGPLESRLALFGNVDWLSVTLEQSYDFAEGDPGVLGGTVDVRTPEGFLDLPVSARAQVDGTYDLDVAGDRVAGDPLNESEADVALELGYLDLVSVDASTGYDWNALPGFEDDFGSGFGENTDQDFSETEDGAVPDAADPNSTFQSAQTQPRGAPRWRPLELGFSVGTLSAGTFGADEGVGARVFYQRDLNVGRPEAVGFEVAAPLGPVQLSAEQTFDFENRSADDSLVQLTWPGVAQLSGTGFRLLPPTLLGLVTDPQNTTTYQLSLLDQTNPDAEVYEVTYETTYGPFSDPVTLAERVGFYNTSVVADVELLHTYLPTALGPIGFGVDFLGQVLVADDALGVSYFSSGDLTLSTDFFSRVGLQGSLNYGANYDPQSETFSESALGLEDFGLTVRLWNDLYVSALVTDIWDFTGQDPTYPAFNLQPILYVTLNRCCWALYGALDTRTGTLSLTVGYPGSSEGFFESAFETPLALPRRQPEAEF